LHTYDPARIGCMLLCTSQETMLDALVRRPLDEGDLVANANTVIYMGRVSAGGQFCRGMYVAKHRGSPATDRIIPFRIDETGIRLEGG
jgi:KaiC/GvpD/RAD55 family RecA-like ATPase